MEELILKEREFRENLARLINESQLPAFIVKPAIKEVFEQLNIIEQQQYENATNAIKQKEKEEDKKENKKAGGVENGKN